MPYTRHGHPYGWVNTDEPKPQSVARCGGPGLCTECSREAARSALPSYTNPDAPKDCAESVARAFHETYERLAPEHGYETRKASAKPWSEVPDNNRLLMTAVVQELLDKGIIQCHC